MKHNLVNNYIYLISAGTALTSFGIGIGAYKLYQNTFENFSIDSISVIFGLLILIITILKFERKVQEIIKKLK